MEKTSLIVLCCLSIFLIGCIRSPTPSDVSSEQTRALPTPIQTSMLMPSRQHLTGSNPQTATNIPTPVSTALPEPEDQMAATDTPTPVLTSIPSRTPTTTPFFLGEVPTPIPQQMLPDTTDWLIYQSESLGFLVKYPPQWTSLFEPKLNRVYFTSNEHFGEGPEQLEYSIQLFALPNPEQQPITQILNEGLCADLPYSCVVLEAEVNSFMTYRTHQVPSMKGALTVFLDVGQQYLIVQLFPYQVNKPFVEQERYAAIFEAMLYTLSTVEDKVSK